MSAGNQTQAQISGANLSNIETICHNVTHSSTEVWVWPVLGNIWTCRILECIQENWGWRAANPAWHGGLSCEGGVSSPWTLLIIADKSQTSLILLIAETRDSRQQTGSPSLHFLLGTLAVKKKFKGFTTALTSSHTKERWATGHIKTEIYCTSTKGWTLDPQHRPPCRNGCISLHK